MSKPSPLVVMLSFLFCFVNGFQGNAQDIIVTKEGKEIKSDIKEITPDFIHYELFEHSDGIIYRINRNLINSVEFDELGDFVKTETIPGPEHPIKKDMKSNFYVVEDKIVNGYFPLEEYLIAYEPSKKYFFKAKRLKSSANIFGGLSIASLAGGIALIRNSNSLGTTIIGGMSILLVMPTSGLIGIVCKSLSKTNRRKSLEKYGVEYFNASAPPPSNKEMIEIQFGVASSGIGIQMNF